MVNLRHFWQRLFEKSLDPQFDVFLFIVALAIGVLRLWISPPSMPQLVKRLVKLVPDISKLLSNLFVIVTFVFSIYVVLLAMFFKRLERIRARRLRALRDAPIAGRIHLFAHRVGLVFAGILLIITGIPLLLHSGALTMGEFLLVI